MGLLVRCCPSLGNQGLQFLLLFRGQFDTVLLSRQMNLSEELHWAAVVLRRPP